MTKEIFAVLAVLVSGLVTVNSTVGWGKVLGQPVNLFAIFWLIILGLVNFAEDKSADAKHWSRWLKRRDGPMIYTRTVQALMRVLDRLIMPGTAQDRPLPERGSKARSYWYMTPRAADRADLGRLRKNPWSWPVYDKALLVAVLYPVLFALAQWTATGQATGIGSVILFDAEERDWLRYGVFGLLALSLALQIAATATLRPWLSIVAFIPAIVALAGALAGAFAFAFAAVVAFALAGAFALAVAGAVAVAGAGAGAGAGAVAVAFAVATLPGRFTHLAKGGLGYAVFTGCLLTALLITALNSDFSVAKSTRASLWLFLGLFPVINAIFDWLSYGLTIWLIRRGFAAKGVWAVVYGVLDIVAAGVMFFGLSLTLTCIIGWLNPFLAAPLIDLPGLFSGLRIAPENHLWVIGMVFSTLVPTLVHLLIVALSVITLAPPKLRLWLEAGITGGDQSGARFTIASMVTAALYAGYAFVLTWGLFRAAGWAWSWHQPVLSNYLDWVQSAARALWAY